MRVLTLVFCLALATLLVACGDEGGGGNEPAAADITGTYILDTGDWLNQAESGALQIRHADIMNQAVGSDPYFGIENPEAEDRPRPDEPRQLDEMSDEEKDAWTRMALDYVRAEARELRETLTLEDDGTFRLTHASRAGEGGSVSLGLYGPLTSTGTWSQDGKTITLRGAETTRGGKTWKHTSEESGSLQDDGSIRMPGNYRNGIRSLRSLYRKK